VSFVDVRGIRHEAEVEAESLYEGGGAERAAISKRPWIEPVGHATVLDLEIREPSTKHVITLQQNAGW